MADPRAPIPVGHFEGVAAPDLSNVFQEARNIGNLQGFNASIEALVERQAEAFKAQAEEKKEKAQAKKDLGNAPDGPGFWSKVADGALDGLSRTLDVISRGSYAVNNTLKYIYAMDNDGININQPFDPLQGLFGKSIFSSVDDFELGDIGGAANAFWRGLSGKDKTTMSEVIAKNAAEDPRNTVHDSKIYQAVTGFAGDVVLDPLTYVGVGLITRPIRATKRAIMDEQADKAVREFAKTAGNAKVTVPGEGGRVLLTEERAYQMLSPARYAHDTKQAKVGEIQDRMTNYAIIREALREQLPDVEFSKVQGLKREIEELDAAFKRELTHYTNKAYVDALMDFDPKRAGISKANFQASVMTNLKGAIKAGEVARAFNKFSYVLRETKNPTAAREAFDNVLGEGWKKDNTIPENLKADIISTVDRIAGNTKVYRDTRGRIKHINKDLRENKQKIRDLTARMDTERAAGNTAEVSRISQEIGRLNTSVKMLERSVKKSYGRENLIKAEIFASVLDHARGAKSSSLKGDWLDLETKMNRAEDIARRLEDMPENMSNSTVQASSDIPEDIGQFGDNAPGTVYDERMDLERQLQDLTREIEEAIHNPTKEMTVPPRFQGKTIKQIENANPQDLTLEEISFRNEVLATVDTLEDKYYPDFLRTAKASKRKENIDIPEKHRDAFLAGEPAITVDGSTVALGMTDNTIADLMEPHFTEADVEEALRQVQRQDLPVYKDGDEVFDNDSIPLPEVVDSNYKSPTAQATKVELEQKHYENKLRTKTAMIAFDRMFKEQHGITLHQARQMSVLATPGKGVKINGLGGKDYGIINSKHLVNIIKGTDPDITLDNIALGMGWKLKNGDTWKKAKRRGVSTNEWRKMLREDMATRSDSEIRILAQERFNKIKGQQSKGHVNVAAPATKEQVKEARRKARVKATNEVQKDIEDGKFKGVAGRSVNFFSREQLNVDEIYEAAVEKARLDYADAKASVAAANALDKAEVAQLKHDLMEKKELMEALQEGHKVAKAEALKTRAEAIKRLDEQFLLNLLNQSTVSNRRSLAVGIFGKQFFPFARLSDLMGNPEVLTRSMERLSKTAIVEKSSELWASAFHPASKLDPELNLARMRSQHRTPDIIRHHTEELFSRFSQYPPSVLRETARSIMNGAPVGDKELIDKINKTFEEFLPYVNGKVKHGDPDKGTEITLTMSEINSKLPDDMRLETWDGRNLDRTEVDSVQDLLKMFRRQGKKDIDPFKLAWHLRIASEQALSEIALDVHVAEMFGVRRFNMDRYATNSAVNVKTRSDMSNMVENLRTKHDWRTVGNLKGHLAEDFFFPPEVAKEIDELKKMMKPQNFNAAMHGFDTALRSWKAAVTIYNPGYYTRNGIGEYYSSWLDGVRSTKPYTMAGKVVKFSYDDQTKEALKSLTPWKKYKDKPTAGEKLFTRRLPNGQKQDVTVEELWVLYHDAGLKTGYISTDFDTAVPQANTLRATPVGQAAHKINNTIRDKGEAFEDYWRIAHFIDRIQRSNRKDLGEAAQEAAEYVRRYHFDYTDFTPFEKNAMLRVFPFYKWTRKSLPLQISMLFAKPGKIMMYPKAMHALSVGTGGTDPLEHDTGFLPNYEDVTPEWIRHLLAYPIGEGDEEGNQTYFNMAIPSFDIYKMLADPGNSAVGMLNPMLKVPLEQNLGQPLDSGFDMPIEGLQGRSEHLMQQTPLTNLLKNIYKYEQDGKDSAVTEPGGPFGVRMDERLLSFLSGLGFYENNPSRQQGELYRRARENM